MIRPGQTVGHIRIEERTGAGGMGAVFVGFDEKLQRRVAPASVGEPRRAGRPRLLGRGLPPSQDPLAAVGPDHPSVGYTLMNLGLLLSQRHDLARAEGALLLAPLLIEEGFYQEALDRLVQLPEDRPNGCRCSPGCWPRNPKTVSSRRTRCSPRWRGYRSRGVRGERESPRERCARLAARAHIWGKDSD